MLKYVEDPYFVTKLQIFKFKSFRVQGIILPQPSIYWQNKNFSSLELCKHFILYFHCNSLKVINLSTIFTETVALEI